MGRFGEVNNPHVVQALDAGVCDGVPYLVLEYLQGLDLRALQRTVNWLSVPVACELVRQAAVGLNAVHEAGLVHRDIKPSNLGDNFGATSLVRKPTSIPGVRRWSGDDLGFQQRQSRADAKCERE